MHATAAITVISTRTHELEAEAAARILQSSFRGLSERRALGAALAAPSVRVGLAKRAARLRRHARGFGALARFLTFAAAFFGALSLQRSASTSFALERPLRSVLEHVSFSPAASARGGGGAGLGQGDLAGTVGRGDTAAGGATAGGGALTSVVTAADAWDWVTAAYRTLYDGSAGAACNECTAQWARCTLCAKRCYTPLGATETAELPTITALRGVGGAAAFTPRARTADAIAADPVRCADDGECASCDSCLSTQCAGRYEPVAWNGICEACGTCYQYCSKCFTPAPNFAFLADTAGCKFGCDKCSQCFVLENEKCIMYSQVQKTIETHGGGYAGTWGAAGTTSLDAHLQTGALMPERWVASLATLSAADPSNTNLFFLAQAATADAAAKTKASGASAARMGEGGGNPACVRAAANPTRAFANSIPQGSSARSSTVDGNSDHGGFQLVSKQLLVLLVQERRAFAGYCPWKMDYGDTIGSSAQKDMVEHLATNVAKFANASDADLPYAGACFGAEDGSSGSAMSPSFVLHPAANASGSLPAALGLLRHDPHVGGYALGLDSGTLDLGVDYGTCALEGARNDVRWLDKRTRSLSLRALVGSRERRGLISFAEVRFEFAAAGGYVEATLRSNSFPVFDYYAAAPDPALYGVGTNGGAGGAAFEREIRLRIALEVVFVVLLASYIGEGALRCCGSRRARRRCWHKCPVAKAKAAAARSAAPKNGAETDRSDSVQGCNGNVAARPLILLELLCNGIFVMMIYQWAGIAHEARGLGIPMDMNVVTPKGYASVVRTFADYTALSARFDAYNATSALAAALLLVRFFGALQFHARVAILGNTLRQAAAELAHFFLLFGAVMGSFAVIGTTLFGSALPQFRTAGRSLQTLAGLLFVGDADGVSFATMHAVVPGLTTPLYYWAFIALVLVLLLNLLLAIVVDAFVVVKTRLDGGGGDCGGGEDEETFGESLLIDLRCRGNLALRFLHGVCCCQRRCRAGGSGGGGSDSVHREEVVPVAAAKVASALTELEGVAAVHIPRTAAMTALARFSALGKASARHRDVFIALGMSPARAAALVSAEVQRHRMAVAASSSVRAPSAAVEEAAPTTAGGNREAKKLERQLAAIECKLGTLLAGCTVARGAST